MRRLICKMALPDELHAEMLKAAAERKCSPGTLVSEALEAVLAARRLPRFHNTYGPRVEHMMGRGAFVVEERAMGQVEPPTLEDISTLEEIQ